MDVMSQNRSVHDAGSLWVRGVVSLLLRWKPMARRMLSALPGVTAGWTVLALEAALLSSVMTTPDAWPPGT